MSGSLSASGRWSQSKSEHHISYLELLASFHALQCFVSNSRSIHVRLAVDNSTAVAYINNMGDVRSPLFTVQKYLGMVQVEGYFHFCSPRTIARWIMSVLQSAGIDTWKFKAHSVRGAAISHRHPSCRYP